MTNGNVMLELEDIHTYYGSIHALKGISIKVNDGEIVTLIGANGAGKSTTLRSINGLNHPRRGKIVFQGRDITSASPHMIACAPSITAFKPEPHTLLIVVHGTSLGSPAKMLACRAGA